MKVLVLNSGSSSVKYKVFEVNGESQVIAKGSVERIGLEGARIQCACCETDWKLCQRQALSADSTAKCAIPDHTAAIDAICKTLLSPDCGIIKDISDLVGIGHRVVHGGEEFTGSVIIDHAVIAGIRSVRAWLHSITHRRWRIEACEQIFQGIPQVAVFDTAFHHTIPAMAYRYAIPKKCIRNTVFANSSRHLAPLRGARGRQDT
jgi:acetate kinase